MSTPLRPPEIGYRPKSLSSSSGENLEDRTLSPLFIVPPSERPSNMAVSEQTEDAVKFQEKVTELSQEGADLITQIDSLPVPASEKYTQLHNYVIEAVRVLNNIGDLANGAEDFPEEPLQTLKEHLEKAEAKSQQFAEQAWPQLKTLVDEGKKLNKEVDLSKVGLIGRVKKITEYLVRTKEAVSVNHDSPFRDQLEGVTADVEGAFKRISQEVRNEVVTPLLTLSSELNTKFEAYQQKEKPTTQDFVELLTLKNQLEQEVKTVYAEAFEHEYTDAWVTAHIFSEKFAEIIQLLTEDPSYTSEYLWKIFDVIDNQVNQQIENWRHTSDTFFRIEPPVEGLRSRTLKYTDNPLEGTSFESYVRSADDEKNLLNKARALLEKLEEFDQEIGVHVNDVQKKKLAEVSVGLQQRLQILFDRENYRLIQFRDQLQRLKEYDLELSRENQYGEAISLIRRGQLLVQETEKITQDPFFYADQRTNLSRLRLDVNQKLRIQTDNIISRAKDVIEVAKKQLLSQQSSEKKPFILEKKITADLPELERIIEEITWGFGKPTHILTEEEAMKLPVYIQEMETYFDTRTSGRKSQEVVRRTLQGSAA